MNFRDLLNAPELMGSSCATGFDRSGGASAGTSRRKKCDLPLCRRL
jgi:hypothetical protein